MSVMIPTVHLNGTKGQELLDGYIAAMKAMVAAGEALAAGTKRTGLLSAGHQSRGNGYQPASAANAPVIRSHRRD